MQSPINKQLTPPRELLGDDSHKANWREVDSMPKVYLNIVSLLTSKTLWPPITLRPFQNLERLLEVVIKARYNGVQVAPIRTSKPNQDFLGLEVLAEEAWNPVWSWIQTLPVVRQAHLFHGAEGEPAYPQDYFIFPNPWTCSRIVSGWRKRGIRFVDHQFGRGGMVEFGPHLGMRVPDVVEKCNQTGTKLVLDTKHLQEFLVATGQVDNWRDIIHQLAPVTVGMHLQPIDIESFFLRLACGDSDQIVETTKEILGTVKNLEFIVAEYKPETLEILSPAVSFAQAVRMRLAIDKILEQTAV